MVAETNTAAEFVPASLSLTKLRRAAAECRGCPLWKDATQTVFGAGPRKAELMLVGEQPGDREDIEGEPFVGPAGGILARALEDAGIDAKDVYLKAVKPTGLLALGATAAKALFGPSVRVTRDRGRLIDSPLAPLAALTLHPSAILRLRDHDEREEALGALVDDLRLLADAAARRE